MLEVKRKENVVEEAWKENDNKEIKKPHPPSG